MLLLDAVTAALGYLGQHPALPIRLAAQSARLRLAVPVPAIHFLLTHLTGAGDLVVEADPPGIRVTTALDLFGTALGVRACVEVTGVEAGPDLLRVTLRVSGLDLKAPAGTPAAQLIGSLDLRRPASLLGMLPVKPGLLAEADDDRFVIDLFRLSALKHNVRLQRVLAILGPLVRVSRVATEKDVLAISLVPRPLGLLETAQALVALRRATAE
ncbi:MAG TPA: hypothetical protein VGQ83_19445 [Polyangia bacterium]